MGTQGGLDVTLPACGAETAEGPYGSLRGADAWHWHRQEGFMDARHTCPWCAPGGDCPHQRRRRNAALEALIDRIEAMLSGSHEEEARWPGAPGHGQCWRGDFDSPTLPVPHWPGAPGHGQCWQIRPRRAWSVPAL